MKIYLKLLKIYLNVLSILAPKYAGKIAVNIFQKIRIKKIKAQERNFYTIATPFKVKIKNKEELHCYEYGNLKGKLIFLVHGWNSNAGSLTRFAQEFSKNNYRVISFDLPAHANSKATHTNLFVCKEAFTALIKHINPTDPFSIIAHSFGSVVTTYTLLNNNFPIDKIIFLSANNKLKHVFRGFQKLVGFNETIFKQVETWIKQKFKEDLATMILTDKLQKVNFEQLLIIHDKFDKVIPFSNAEEIHSEIPNSKLKAFEKIGHYRMLWNEQVVKESVKFIIP